MGGAGSGRAKGYNERRITEAAKKLQTPETKEFLMAKAIQKGDRLFEVSKVYADGTKASLGTTGSSKIADLGKKFGGGIYEVQEIDRATDLPTGEVIRRTLHPSIWPVKRNLDLTPDEFEAQMIPDAVEDRPAGRASLSGLSADQIYEKALGEITAKLVKEREQQQLKDTLTALQQQVAALTAQLTNPQQTSLLAQAKEVFEVFKTFQSPPTPAASPVSQMMELTQLLSGIGQFKEQLGEITGGKSGIRPEVSPMVDKLLGTMTGLADSALRAYASNQMNAGREPGQIRTAVKPSPVIPNPNPTQEELEEELDNVMQEVTTMLLSYQTDQLGAKPSTKIQDALGWMKDQFSKPGPAQKHMIRLRDMIKKHDHSEIHGVLSIYGPELINTPEKKQWLDSLVDLIKAEG